MKSLSDKEKFIRAGREAQYEELYDALKMTRDGLPQVKLVTGRVGAGKTTLLHHLCDNARTADKIFPTLFENTAHTLIAFENCY